MFAVDFLIALAVGATSIWLLHSLVLLGASLIVPPGAVDESERQQERTNQSGRVLFLSCSLALLVTFLARDSGAQKTLGPRILSRERDAQSSAGLVGIRKAALGLPVAGNKPNQPAVRHELWN